MESNEIREQLLEAERAAAAPYVIYPKDPWWYPVLVGFIGPLLVLVFTQTIGAFAGKTTWGALPSLAITLIALYIVFDQRRRRGTMPRGKAPRELRGVYRWYFTGAVVVAISIGALALLAPIYVSLPASFLLAFGGIMWFGAAYERAAARVRARLA